MTAPSELRPGMVFQTDRGLVKLDRTVSVHGTTWYVGHWHNDRWFYDGWTIEPGELRGKPLRVEATRYNRLTLPFAPLSEGVPPIGEIMSISLNLQTVTLPVVWEPGGVNSSRLRIGAMVGVGRVWFTDGAWYASTYAHGGLHLGPHLTLEAATDAVLRALGRVG
jgi:hypothetical protein